MAVDPACNSLSFILFVALFVLDALNILREIGKQQFLDEIKPHGYTIIDNYRYVISSQSEKSFYLKCANFRQNSCKARAIIRKDTMDFQMRRVPHNHPALKHVKA